MQIANVSEPNGAPLGSETFAICITNKKNYINFAWIVPPYLERPKIKVICCFNAQDYSRNLSLLVSKLLAPLYLGACRLAYYHRCVKKLKLKFRKNCFSKCGLRIALLALNEGCFNKHFLCKWRFANLNTYFSLDFEKLFFLQ